MSKALIKLHLGNLRLGETLSSYDLKIIKAAITELRNK